MRHQATRHEASHKMLVKIGLKQHTGNSPMGIVRASQLISAAWEAEGQDQSIWLTPIASKALLNGLDPGQLLFQTETREAARSTTDQMSRILGSTIPWDRTFHARRALATLFDEPGKRLFFSPDFGPLESERADYISLRKGNSNDRSGTKEKRRVRTQLGT